MKFSLLLVILFGGLLAAAPTTAPSDTAAPTTAPAAADKPVNTKCPVSKEDIDSNVTTTYQGKTIGFCCKDCIKPFQKDPEKYMKDLK